MKKILIINFLLLISQNAKAGIYFHCNGNAGGSDIKLLTHYVTNNGEGTLISFDAELSSGGKVMGRFSKYSLDFSNTNGDQEFIRVSDTCKLIGDNGKTKFSINLPCSYFKYAEPSGWKTQLKMKNYRESHYTLVPMICEAKFDFEMETL